MQTPRIALVHDWLNQKIGGAERVLFELADLFPQAPIYTLLYNPAKFEKLIPPARVRTSILQRAPASLRRRPRYLLPLVPKAVEALDLAGFDIVISSSTGYVKNIQTLEHTFHICYCHSPLRYAWDYWEKYLVEQRLDPVRRLVASNLRRRIKRWDSSGTDRVDMWLANSQTVARRIKDFYHQSARVIYPPVATSNFKPIPPKQKQNFYITMGLLTPYKKIDLAITACNLSRRRLLVLGEGSENKRLQKLASDNVKLLGFVNENRRRHLLSQARGLIFPSLEDFGIAPVEAMAAGTPVIAYGAGGLTETIVDGKTGIFFKPQTPQALNAALDRFESLEFYQPDLINQARKFDARVFRDSIKNIIDEVTKRHVRTD